MTNSTTTLYGIKNCDTIKKAKKWLEQNNIDYTFHDYRTDGLTENLLTTFEAELGWESLLNKRGTTFRQLDDSQKESLERDPALALMLAQPAMIKRPVLVTNSQYHLGFKTAQYQVIFEK
ncbi:ArsC family reductase [Flocculibacter collagenilyticus]|uniref:ArsC family reductase n=1 Tax=Flocculibacter collagenilyticus TaxID=2744479 RepID=UPI0018F3A5D9|nr:ArsC family reductase [Flocculibacter collagenilyticus]